MNNAITRTKGFFREVKEEVGKCTRPSWEELKESTIVVVTTMAALGALIFGMDYVINASWDGTEKLINWMAGNY